MLCDNPQGVSLQGAGMDLTAIYFKEQQLDNHTAGFTAAPSSYINYNSTSALASGGPNAIEDLCFYITMYYNSLVNLPPTHDGFR